MSQKNIIIEASWFENGVFKHRHLMSAINAHLAEWLYFNSIPIGNDRESMERYGVKMNIHNVEKTTLVDPRVNDIAILSTNIGIISPFGFSVYQIVLKSLNPEIKDDKDKHFCIVETIIECVDEEGKVFLPNLLKDHFTKLLIGESVTT